MEPMAAEKSAVLWLALSSVVLSRSKVDNLISGSDGKA